MIQKQYMTRNGKFRTDDDTLRILLVDTNRIIAARKMDDVWYPMTCSPDGRVYGARDSDADIVGIEPERRKVAGWFTEYDHASVGPYPSKAVANAKALGGCRACVYREYEYELGEGL